MICRNAFIFLSLAVLLGAPVCSYGDSSEEAYRIIIQYSNSKTYTGDRECYVKTRPDAIADEVRTAFGSLGMTNLAFLRNEIFARHGYFFAKGSLQHIFENSKWYRRNPNFQERQLNWIEKQNIDYLKDFEEKISINNNNQVSSTIQTVSKDQKARLLLTSSGSPALLWIEWRPQVGNYDMDYVLHINESSTTATGENMVTTYRVVNFDKASKLKTILVSEDGPSDDPETTFFYYDGKAIYCIGKLPGQGSELAIAGDGTVQTSHARGHVLQTWIHNQIYRLDGSGMLQPIDKGLYPMWTAVKVKQVLNIQRSVADSVIADTLNPGEDAVLMASDDEKWVQVQSKRGVKGWFAVSDYNKIYGEERSADDVFDGLSHAD